MDADAKNYRKWTIGLIIGLLLFRIWALFVSPLGLHGDEAQYWAWSKALDWGYFTKPPLIAWVIWTTTSIFGDAEWAVRLASPILHSFTAWVLFATTRMIYDARTGFLAVLIYLLMPALWLSSGIITTDVPLLLCWVIALNAWLHLRNGPSWPRALQLGLAFGIGMLAKYAMLFFLPAIGLAFLFDKSTRRALGGLKGAAAGLVAIALITPNMIWNMNNDFATLSHTADNANLHGVPFHPMEFLKFFGDQFGVFGPVSFVLMLAALFLALRKKLDPPSFWLSLFALSPLLIISLEAILSRANANWAVTAYIAGPMLTAHMMVKFWPRIKTFFTIGFGLQFLICLVMGLSLLNANWTDSIGLSNAVKRMRQWPATVDTIEEIYKKGHDGTPFVSAAFDKRIIYYDLNYYGLADRIPMAMWMYGAAPMDHAELTDPLGPTKGPVLIVNYYIQYDDELRDDFKRLERLPDLDIDLGGGKRRTLRLWAGYDYTPTTGRGD